MNIDVGTNVVYLVQQLATQVGTTAEKVFPWYIQQQTLEGWTLLVAILIPLFIGVIVVAFNYGKAIFEGDGNRNSVLTIAGSIIFAISLFALLVNSKEILTKISNPEYWAMHEIVKDISSFKK